MDNSWKKLVLYIFIWTASLDFSVSFSASSIFFNVLELSPKHFIGLFCRHFQTSINLHDDACLLHCLPGQFTHTKNSFMTYFCNEMIYFDIACDSSITHSYNEMIYTKLHVRVLWHILTMKWYTSTLYVTVLWHMFTINWSTSTLHVTVLWHTVYNGMIYLDITSDSFMTHFCTEMIFFDITWKFYDTYLQGI